MPSISDPDHDRSSRQGNGHGSGNGHGNGHGHGSYEPAPALMNAPGAEGRFVPSSRPVLDDASIVARPAMAPGWLEAMVEVQARTAEAHVEHVADSRCNPPHR